jgi:hypothetical protein
MNVSRIVYQDELNEFIIEFMKSLEQVEVNRVRMALQQSDDLLREVDHYYYKLKSMEWNYRKLGLTDRIRRNHVKYAHAKRVYDDQTQDLCLLIEELVDRGWRDLFPCILKLLQYDLHNATYEYEAVCNFHDIVESLERIGDKFQVKLGSRVLEIKQSSAAELCTRELEMNGVRIPLYISPSIDMEDRLTNVTSQGDLRQCNEEDDSFKKERVQAASDTPTQYGLLPCHMEAKSPPVDRAVEAHYPEYHNGSNKLSRNKYDDLTSNHNSHGDTIRQDSIKVQEPDLRVMPDDSYYGDKRPADTGEVGLKNDSPQGVLLKCEQEIDDPADLTAVETHHDENRSGANNELEHIGEQNLKGGKTPVSYIVEEPAITVMTGNSDYVDMDITLAPAPLCE